MLSKEHKPKYCLPKFSFSGRLRFLFTLYAWLFVMLSFAYFRKNTGFCALSFKPSQRTVQRLIIFKSDFRHVISLPPLPGYGNRYRGNPPSNTNLFLLYIITTLFVKTETIKNYKISFLFIFYAHFHCFSARLSHSKEALIPHFWKEMQRRSSA